MGHKAQALKAAKEARGGGHFLPLPLAVLHCQALANLSPHAAKLLLDIASQWRLGRNGDASADIDVVPRSSIRRRKLTARRGYLYGTSISSILSYILPQTNIRSAKTKSPP